jgi:hypothetical protein
MKVCIKYNKKDFTNKKFKILIKFLKFLNKKLPLTHNIELDFLDKRIGQMTTGSFLNKTHRAKILVKGRLMSDIMRTLSHEWAHAYDRENLHIKDRRDVGGDSENYANSISGVLTKYFIKHHKVDEGGIYH